MISTEWRGCSSAICVEPTLSTGGGMRALVDLGGFLLLIPVPESGCPLILTS